MNFVGTAKLLDDIDLPKIGHRIGVGEDEIHAVLDVEAGRSGFDSKRRPKMLFEPHIFYRQLGPGKARDRAVSDRLAYPKWGQEPYPADSYLRLERAMQIHDEAALKSASWGRGQIMGFNATAAGYSTVLDMIEAFKADEENHLDAMVTFIITNGLDDELREHDWAGFARGYNGSGYAKHGYHIKLAAAFKKWQAIRDTPWLPGLPDSGPAPVEADEPAGSMLAVALGQLQRIRAILDEK